MLDAEDLFVELGLHCVEGLGVELGVCKLEFLETPFITLQTICVAKVEFVVDKLSGGCHLIFGIA